jgi:Helicase conserved C-terminal domain
VSGINQLKLENLFQYWNLNDTQRVARRFQRGVKVTNTAAARKVITDALTKNLPEFLASLSLEEHQLLWRVRLAGGAISGWSLVSFAALAGWVTEGNKSQVYGYREMPAGANFLRPFVENGILIPNNTQINSWNPESRYYGTPSSNDDLIGADHRILEAIIEPPKLEFTGFDLPEVPLTGAPARAFVAPLLELHEAYRAVQLEGRLPLTQEGSPHKGTLKRMQKSSALQGETLTMNLLALLKIGVLTGAGDGKHLEPSVNAWKNFGTLPVETQLELLTQVFLSLPSNMATGSNIDDAVTNAAAGREALVLCASLLKHPVALEPFARAVTERVLRFVTFERGFFSRSNQERAALTHWAQHQLGPNGVLAQLGLVRSNELGTKNAAVAPGGLLAGVQASLEKPDRNEKCWIVQANFELLVYLEQLPARFPEALQAAELVRLDAQTATYRLTRQGVYGALERGLKLEKLISELEQFSIVPMPASVERSLFDWAERRDRLKVSSGCNLIEYESRAARDAALELQPGARGVGEVFVLGIPAKLVPRIIYGGIPTRSIVFLDDGRFTAPSTDLIARTLIETSSVSSANGSRMITPEGARKAGRALVEALEARAKTPIPSSFKAILEIWTGASNAPSLETVSVFQHDRAALLVGHPDLKGYFAGLLAPNLALVPNTNLNELRRALEKLGVTTGKDLKTGTGPSVLPKATTSNPGLNTGVIPGMQYQLDTRKMRELIERTILSGDNLELLYAEERYKSSYYGYSEKVKGKQRRERVKPVRVFREGSIPYMEATTLEPDAPRSKGARGDGNERIIRIGYIVGIAVEPAV